MSLTIKNWTLEVGEKLDKQVLFLRGQLVEARLPPTAFDLPAGDTFLDVGLEPFVGHFELVVDVGLLLPEAELPPGRLGLGLLDPNVARHGTRLTTALLPVGCDVADELGVLVGAFALLVGFRVAAVQEVVFFLHIPIFEIGVEAVAGGLGALGRVEGLCVEMDVTHGAGEQAGSGRGGGPN